MILFLENYGTKEGIDIYLLSQKLLRFFEIIVMVNINYICINYWNNNNLKIYSIIRNNHRNDRYTFLAISLKKKKWADFKKRDKQFWIREITRLQSEYWSQEIVLKTARYWILQNSNYGQWNVFNYRELCYTLFLISMHSLSFSPFFSLSTSIVIHSFDRITTWIKNEPIFVVAMRTIFP